MKPNSRSKTKPNLTVQQLIKELHESGFSLELKREEVLLAESAKPQARTRATAAKRGVKAQIKGLIVPDSNTILINRDLPTDERVITALHELVHLKAPELSETETEQEALRLYRESNDRDLGYLEFLVS